MCVHRVQPAKVDTHGWGGRVVQIAAPSAHVVLQSQARLSPPLSARPTTQTNAPAIGTQSSPRPVAPCVLAGSAAARISSPRVFAQPPVAGTRSPSSGALVAAVTAAPLSSPAPPLPFHWRVQPPRAGSPGAYMASASPPRVREQPMPAGSYSPSSPPRSSMASFVGVRAAPSSPPRPSVLRQPSFAGVAVAGAVAGIGAGSGATGAAVSMPNLAAAAAAALRRRSETGAAAPLAAQHSFVPLPPAAGPSPPLATKQLAEPCLPAKGPESDLQQLICRSASPQGRAQLGAWCRGGAAACASWPGGQPSGPPESAVPSTWLPSPRACGS
eukprot:CAMPEP_0204198886 /NCGR_PEP_ID=MMETSP0361-20130328/65604_1 /ASSEMBLY_ACC=CAM_ASM_000343 /TAXON_ID=268821 /ORGANISM="Scrippsiella Hangoei, Strain SHTV-5" /LENGTH=327 /DNA_ID=CAMNT_0051161081 /DNA_START=60 /DNA_END=1039 /DNA_ORIENTATION=-